MRTGCRIQLLLGLVAMALSLSPAAADDPAPAIGDIARPSVEELAIPLQKPAEAARESDTREAMCLMIESAARAASLPLEFFARVIWQESRFQADAVGPVTRNGQRAQGIAQFMPGTANERRLLDPFDPVQALPKSAEFLGELRVQFGNLGLAAAAYNAGPRRVQEWLAGSGPAPNPFVAGLEQHIALAAAKLWGVQLAAGFSRDKALAMYARAVKRLSTVIGDQDPSLLSSRMLNRGTRLFYQVRIGADTRPAADDLCNRIRKAGGACFVLRNRA